MLRFATSADRASGTIDAIFKVANPNLKMRPDMHTELPVEVLPDLSKPTVIILTESACAPPSRRAHPATCRPAKCARWRIEHRLSKFQP